MSKVTTEAARKTVLDAVIAGVFALQVAVAASPAVAVDDPPDPILFWGFEDAQLEEVTSLEVVGNPVADVAGPRPPEFPDFAPDNTALGLDGRTWLKFADPTDGRCRFDVGDAISIEAWVRVSSIRDGDQIYIIGKGRFGHSGMARDNQSWALRLRGTGGTARVSFLFRSADQAAAGDQQEAVPGEFHRWNSDLGFAPDGIWHHVAVSFRFGDKSAPVAWIDGTPSGGSWDMGGQDSSRGPIQDEDQIWIGSSQGGNPRSTFRGALDELAVYRRMLTDEDISARWKTTRPQEFLPELTDAELPQDTVTVEIREHVQVDRPWDRERTRVTMRWQQEIAALHRLPQHYIQGGLAGDRSNPATLRLRTYIETPELKSRILIRARSRTRLLIDGVEVAELEMMSSAASGHQEVPEPPAPLYVSMHPVAAGNQEIVVPIELAAGRHLIELETLAGGRNMRLEIGDTLVAFGDRESGFELLGHSERVRTLDESDWRSLVIEQEQFLRELEARTRRETSVAETGYWNSRHQQIREWLGDDARRLQAGDIDTMLERTLADKGLQPLPLADDLTFLRRLTLNTTGAIPQADEIDWYLQQPAETRRSRAIDRFLQDSRWADHWVSYWQDVLAENPGILKPELNNSGPFRWWIHEAFLDNRPMDRFATELVQMKGSQLGGGPAGFAMASQNDVPMAERAIVLASAFRANNLACARCHDSPVNDVTQQSLFEIAALLNRGPLEVPETSSVPKGPDGQRHAAVTVSLEPGSVVQPNWPFAERVADAGNWSSLLRDPADTREQLALQLTHPQQSQFAEVIVNRLWTRLFGQGLMQSTDDWFQSDSADVELLRALAAYHMASGYDLKATARLLMNTRAWQREAAPAEAPIAKLFGAVTLQKMTAEQVVDSLYTATGKAFDAEKLTLDPEGRRPASTFQNLGAPLRAWQLCSLSNERDRPALALPVSQSLVDLMSVFGWRESRTHTQTIREADSTVLQPLTMANGNAGHRIVQLSDNSAFTELSLASTSSEELTRQLFLRILTREPTSEELQEFAAALAPGFQQRRVAGAVRRVLTGQQNVVSWSNHLNREATRIKQEQEEAARLGDPPTEMLQEEWRLAAEDVIWVLLNSPEFCFVP